MSLKIKVPVADLEKNNVCEMVRKKLESDPKNAYTIMGLMVELGVKEDDIRGKPFSQWKKGQPTMYSRIRKCLEQLQVDGIIKASKHQRADVFWWGK